MSDQDRQPPWRTYALKVAITAVGAGAIVARIVWPDIKIDAITIGLVILVALPWLSGIFDSLEFPGGWKISYRKFENATQQIPDPPEDFAIPDAPPRLPSETVDANLALVGLRIELERRLLAAAEANSIEVRTRGLRGLTDALRRQGLIDSDTATALNEMISMGNSAAHGAEVTPEVRDLVLKDGPRILAYLDGLARPT